MVAPHQPGSSVFPSDTQVCGGIPVPASNPALASKVVWTVAVSSVYCGLTIVFALYGAVEYHNIIGSLLTIAVALGVLGCGYHGAKNKNRSSLSAFYGCNFLGCCCSFCGAGSLIFFAAIISIFLAALSATHTCCAELSTCDPVTRAHCTCNSSYTAGDEKFYALYVEAAQYPACATAGPDGGEVPMGTCVESSIGEGSESGDAFSSDLGAGKEHYQLCCYDKKTCDSTDESYNNFGAISGLKFFAAIFVVMGLCGCVSGVLGMKLANDPYDPSLEEVCGCASAVLSRARSCLRLAYDHCLVHAAIVTHTLFSVSFSHPPFWCCSLGMDRYFASQPVISNGYMAAGPGGMMGVPTQPAYTTAQVQFSRQCSLSGIGNILPPMVARCVQ